MMGQNNVFYASFPEKLPSVIERYHNETHRLLSVLNDRLSNHEYLAGDFSIADIANWTWARSHDYGGISIDPYTHLQRWIKSIDRRPKAAEGLNIPYLNK